MRFIDSLLRFLGSIGARSEGTEAPKAHITACTVWVRDVNGVSHPVTKHLYRGSPTCVRENCNARNRRVKAAS